MIARFLGAIQFLTVLPIRRQTCAPGEAAWFFPVMGALLGGTVAAVFEVLVRPLGASLAALLALAALLLLTGGLHEDGLADVADAFRAGRTREKIFSILKDSRIGTYGALALTVTLAIRWQAMAAIGARGAAASLLASLSACLALSRATMVLLAAGAPASGTGLGAAFAAGLSRPLVLAVVAQAILFSLLAGWRRGSAMLLADLLIVALARAYFLRRLGGVNGDCLGATCQVAETVNLLVMAWQPFS